MKLSSADGTFKFNATFLLLHLKNSINHPIRLALHFPRDVKPPDESTDLIHPSVDPLLLARMPMIQTLVLINPSTTWYQNLSKLSTLRELEIYTLSPPLPYDVSPLPLNACSSLRRLLLHGVETESTGRILYRIPLSVTTLDLSGIPVDTCIQLVLQSTGLVELYLRQPSRPHRWFDNAAKNARFNRGVSLEYLEHLYWEFPGFTLAWREAFLMHTRMPSLRHLEIMDSWNELDSPTGTAGHVHFFQQLPSTLVTLELNTACNLSGTHYQHLFNPNSSIRRLALNQCTLQFVLGVLNKLTPKPGEAKCMPRLDHFSIGGCLRRAPIEDDDDILDEFRQVEPIISMLQSRLTSGDEFRLEISRIVVEWTPVHQATLRDLVRSGVKLEIVEDSEQADWLLI